MPQPRQPGGAPKRQPRRPPPPTQTPPEGSVAAAAAVAGAIGALPGAAAATGGVVVPAVLAALSAAALRRALGRVSLILGSQSRAREDFLRYFVADVMARVRRNVTAAEVREAAKAERAREATFRQRQRARLRVRLLQAGRETDPKRRERRMAGVLAQERNYSRQRELAIAARAAGAANARNVRDASPEGAVWQLGHRKDHCPGCAYLHGRALPWSAIVAAGMLPPVGPGCGCELRGIRQAWLMALVPTVPTVPSDSEAAGILATAAALGHPHGHDGGATMIGAGA